MSKSETPKELDNVPKPTVVHVHHHHYYTPPPVKKPYGAADVLDDVLGFLYNPFDPPKRRR